ncbi:MAG TPA: S8 family serine peptidase, partial [Polyangiaceae bacterium]|nr:S8 family serine peptidase [Polyangiaceae bacterium]
NGVDIVRLLGDRAANAFAVAGGRSRDIHAQVVLPPGKRAADFGLAEIAPGFARFTGSPAGIVSFADAHPELRLEVMPPLHPLLNSATRFVLADQANAEGMDGTGVLVGIADTGLDVTHPDFLDASGHTRVAWLLDLSATPLGLHADLEQMFGVPSSSGLVSTGAVWSGADIDAAIAAGKTSTLPHDEVGHGTLVTSCAAGNGENGRSAYRGVAPGATLVIARITGAGTDAIDTDDMLRGVSFLFNRADALGEPMVVNLSLGSDFGPHDGTLAWEQSLAAFVGSGHPGRALVAAAGNSGSISVFDGPLVHQNVHVNEGTTARVPLPSQAAKNGTVEIWVALHAGASVSVGLDGPDGTWITPVDSGKSASHTASGLTSAIYNGAADNSPVPAQSQGAVIAWQGAWTAGTFYVTLAGQGTADLYVQATGDATSPAGVPLCFADGVRQSTINLPATNAGIIGVGCTINKTFWVAGGGVNSLEVPLLDGVGGLPDRDANAVRFARAGEPCWFSSAGPNLDGVQKPEIMAPGAAIVGALSQQAVPPSATSIFDNASCGSSSASCEVIDELHGVSAGTSFSAPIVSGTVAVLLQHDPTLTQPTILAALQGGAHPLRGPASFPDQAGTGEVDVIGALAAVDRLRDPVTALPVAAESWLAVGAEAFFADGSTPLQAVLELRAARPPGSSSAPPADGFDERRLDVFVEVDGRRTPGGTQAVRRGPGVWAVTATLPAGLGGSTLTLGANFDGAPIVAAKTIPIAADVWSAEYATSVGGGCAVSAPRTAGGDGVAWVAAVAGIVGARAGRRRRSMSMVRRARPVHALLMMRPWIIESTKTRGLQSPRNMDRRRNTTA